MVSARVVPTLDPGPSRDVGHVGHPQLIGRSGTELAVHQVGRWPLARIALGRYCEAAPAAGRDAQHAAEGVHACSLGFGLVRAHEFVDGVDVFSLLPANPGRSLCQGVAFLMHLAQLPAQAQSAGSQITMRALASDRTLQPPQKSPGAGGGWGEGGCVGDER